MKELSIGPLTLVGEEAGAHVHIRVLGEGPPGHRPLCGSFTTTALEWRLLEATATAMLIAARPAAVHGTEVARRDLELAAQRAEVARLRDREVELAASLRATTAARDSARRERDAARAECHARRFDPNMQPILSVLGDWDWQGIDEDYHPATDDTAIRALVKAMASVERSVGKEQGE